MSKENAPLGEDVFDPHALGSIFRLATERAATYVAQTPRFAEQLAQALNREDEAVREAMLQEDYLAAAAVLESDHLTYRQQEVARLAVGLVVVSDQLVTRKTLTTAAGTRPGTTLTTLSVLTAQKDHHTPRGLRFEYRLPLLTEVAATDDQEAHYVPAKALQWCLDKPGRHPGIDEIIFEAALSQTPASGSL